MTERNPYHEPAGSEIGGQFTRAPGGKSPEDVIVKAAREAAGLKTTSLIEQLREGGFSESLDGQNPTRGYMVALSKDSEIKIPMGKVTDASIMDYVLDNYEALSKPNAYLGGWSDGGNAFIDVSYNVFELDEALRLAVKGEQEAVYDISSGESIYTREAVK